MTKNSEEKREQWRKQNEKRRRDPEYREKQAIWAKNWYEARKSDPELLARKAADQKRYRNTPGLRERHEARWQVNRAIKSGALMRQPCEVCGCENAEAHHDDYSLPLEVRWLCVVHHREHHAKAGAA